MSTNFRISIVTFCFRVLRRLLRGLFLHAPQRKAVGEIDKICGTVATV